MTKNVDVYEVLRHGEVIATGTIEECAKKVGVQSAVIRNYITPKHLQKVKAGILNTEARIIGQKEVPKVYICDYAIYRGDDFVTVGDLYVIAKELNLAPSTIQRMATPKHIEEAEKTGALVAFRIEKEDEDE